VVADDDVGGVDGLALGAVRRARVGQLDGRVDVVGRHLTDAVAVCQLESAVDQDAGDGPGVAVGDAEVRIVASGADAIADRQELARTGSRRWSAAAELAVLEATRLDGGVERRDLVSGVGDDETSLAGQCVQSLDVGGVETDLAAGQEPVEDFSRALSTAHQQAEVGVLRVLEAMDDVEGELGVGWGDVGGEVEDASASDRGKLVPITEQDEPGVGFVRDRHECEGRVLVEHAGLVDEEDVAAW
jgi:hypothetical protein